MIRKILHVDMDAFYASVEQRDDPSLGGKPVAVGGRPDQRGVVAAASYEARAFGVRSAMSMAKAVRLCPALVIVPPDFRRYKAASSAVFAIFREVTALVEPLSLDEAYLDVTENTWGEPHGTAVAKRLKARIRAETGLTASAGVAPNKFLAKIASGWKKPDGLTVISPERVEPFLQKLPVDALWGVGPVTAEKLRAKGSEKLVDVRTADLPLLGRTEFVRADIRNPLIAKVISQAGVDTVVHASVTATPHRAGGRAPMKELNVIGTMKPLAHGIDERPVVADREVKSSGSETTYPEDLTSLDVIREQIAELAGHAAAWLHRRELFARTITIKVRYSDFTTISRSHTAPATRDQTDLTARAVRLLDKTEAGARAVRLLGVSVHNIGTASGIDRLPFDEDIH